MTNVFAQVVKVEYTITDQECGGECAQQGGEDYWWCRKPMRWAGKYSDANWDYCSPEPTRTRLGQKKDEACRLMDFCILQVQQTV